MLNEIHCLDYKDIIPSISDSSIDFICIDPPYEIDYGQYDWDKKGSIDYQFLTEQFHRILKDSGNLVIFQGWSNASSTKLIFEEKFILRNWIIWDRIKGRGAKKNFTSTREDILWFTKTDKYTFNKEYSTIKKKTGGLGLKNGNEFRSLSNIWSDVSPIVPWSKERNCHPTQKPLQLGERLVRIFSNEDDVLLDCFCGSGTFIVAAKKLNRNFIGCDFNQQYVDLTNKRLREYNNEFF